MAVVVLEVEEVAVGGGGCCCCWWLLRWGTTLTCAGENSLTCAAHYNALTREVMSLTGAAGITL